MQEIGGVALALGEDRHQHVGAGHLLAAGGLHMDDGALDHALEAGGRLGVLAFVVHQVLELGVEIVAEARRSLSRSTLQARITARGVLVVDQRQQQVLERGDIRGGARWRGEAERGFA